MCVCVCIRSNTWLTVCVCACVCVPMFWLDHRPSCTPTSRPGDTRERRQLPGHCVGESEDCCVVLERYLCLHGAGGSGSKTCALCVCVSERVIKSLTDFTAQLGKHKSPSFAHGGGRRLCSLLQTYWTVVAGIFIYLTKRSAYLYLCDFHILYQNPEMINDWMTEGLATEQLKLTDLTNTRLKMKSLRG